MIGETHKEEKEYRGFKKKNEAKKTPENWRNEKEAKESLGENDNGPRNTDASRHVPVYPIGVVLSHRVYFSEEAKSKRT
jgi:hypothetical protein